MSIELKLYNSLSRQKEPFKPIHPPAVGLYVCGPTVYGDPHLGHARSAITFDILFRYLRFSGYQVRYVRNITDVGHLTDDSDEGEDKILKKARLEKLEPMEVAQYYTRSYRECMQQLNTLPPSIEPTASGHILEQISWIQQIMAAGLAYEIDGSVYFDLNAYQKNYHYGELSGRVLDELIESGRSLDGQDIKKHKSDFALWKKAAPEHIMKWNSPWGWGFPGWHIECSAMSAKYLGLPFDIHGGGMDLLFPHHECEIAQSKAFSGVGPANLWMHNNMITINGQKMGKSLGNAISLQQFFDGTHPILERAYDPMTIRFFMLQSHYRSTLDFSNDALQAAEKGLKKLFNSLKLLQKLPQKLTFHTQQTGEGSSIDADILDSCEELHHSMNDDLNTATAIAALFHLSTRINSIDQDSSMGLPIAESTFHRLTKEYPTFLQEVLGLKDPENEGDTQITDGLIRLLIDMRQHARLHKDFAASDKIRDELLALGIQLKDGKSGTEWSWI